MNVFTYGSLMDLEIFAAVTGEEPASVPAILPGYARRAVLNEEYPGIFADVNEQVEGRLYHSVSAAALKSLDEFEGEYYSRKVLAVHSGENRYMAETYIFRDKFRHLLADKPWNWDAFLREGKARFQKNYFGFSEKNKRL